MLAIIFIVVCCLMSSQLEAGNFETKQEELVLHCEKCNRELPQEMQAIAQWPEKEKNELLRQEAGVIFGCFPKEHAPEVHTRIRNLICAGVDANFLKGSILSKFCNDEAMVAYLLDHGSDPNLPTLSSGSSAYPIFYVVKPRILELLLKRGANVNQRTPRQSIILHHLMDLNHAHREEWEMGQVELIKTCLEHGALVNAKDRAGKTPLHELAEASDLYGDRMQARDEILRALVDRGIDIEAKDKEGRQAIEYIQFSNLDTQDSRATKEHFITMLRAYIEEKHLRAGNFEYYYGKSHNI